MTTLPTRWILMRALKHQVRSISIFLPSLPKAEPWRPFFKMREDFLFSEVLMEVGMNKDRTERLIEVVRLCIEGKGSLTLSNYSDFPGAWERASLQLTAVSPHLAPHDGGPTDPGICSSGVELHTQSKEYGSHISDVLRT
ncbi:hypothetical protein EDB86DRAFT_2977268 [Lactarius hatsudake]|nr:hypothetical protein EDB86DRAFT_2977268 [Lactarius hatsudake]